MEWTRRGFERQGFEGWHSFGDLVRSDLPKEHAVYVVLAEPSGKTPDFLRESVGGTHKREALTVDPSVLQAAWHRGTEVLYIGKAGAGRGLVASNSVVYRIPVSVSLQYGDGHRVILRENR